MMMIVMMMMHKRYHHPSRDVVMKAMSGDCPCRFSHTMVTVKRERRGKRRGKRRREEEGRRKGWGMWVLKFRSLCLA